MLVVLTSAILLTAIPTAAPIHITRDDLLGMWVTVSGDCAQGQHFFSADGTCKVWCFDSVSEGKWSLRNGNKIAVKLDPKTRSEEIITVIRIARYSDHTQLELRYPDGTREKWLK
jgi:hypothetical protein